MKKRRWRSSVPAMGLAVLVLGLVVSTINARLAKANAPPCRYAIKTTTVFDNETMLTWQRASDNNPYTWIAADAYCKNLSLDGATWRLPTVQELLSIVDESKTNPAIDDVAFPVTFSTYFWSSSSYVGAADVEWVVDFAGGQTGRGGVGDSVRVRCVH